MVCSVGRGKYVFEGVGTYYIPNGSTWITAC